MNPTCARATKPTMMLAKSFIVSSRGMRSWATQPQSDGDQHPRSLCQVREHLGRGGPGAQQRRPTFAPPGCGRPLRNSRSFGHAWQAYVSARCSLPGILKRFFLQGIGIALGLWDDHTLTILRTAGIPDTAVARQWLRAVRRHLQRSRRAAAPRQRGRPGGRGGAGARRAGRGEGDRCARPGREGPGRQLRGERGRWPGVCRQRQLERTRPRARALDARHGGGPRANARGASGEQHGRGTA